MKKVLFLSFMYIVYIHASDGILDPNFGAGFGHIVISPGSFVGGIAVQTDNKIVVVGTSLDNKFRTVRYTIDGAADLTFGTASVATGPNGVPFDVLIQPDNKIIVAGQSSANTFQLVRYLFNGTADTTFGTGGTVVGPTGLCSSITLQTDNKIVAAGSDNVGNVLVVRYNASGSIDTAFTSGPLGFVESVKIQNDEKIVVSGTNQNGNIQVIRYNTNGTLDNTFGVNGVTTGPQGIATSMVIFPDNSVIVGGYDLSNPSNMQLVRFDDDGSFTLSYGTSGVVTGPAGIINDLILQSDDKVVAVGEDNNRIIELLRFETDGDLDISFGISGITTFAEGSGENMSVQSNTNLLVANLDATYSTFQVERYFNSPALVKTAITSPSQSATGTVNFSGTVQNPSTLYFYLDDSFIDGFTSDIGGTDTWSMSTTINNPGVYVARVVSLYKDANMNNVHTKLVRIYG